MDKLRTLPAVLRREPDDDAILGPALVATLETRLAAARRRLREAQDPVRFPVDGAEMTAAVLRVTRFAS